MNDLWHDLTHLWTDPAHLLFEVSVDVVVNTLYLLVITPLWLWFLRRHDRETHGIGNESDETREWEAGKRETRIRSLEAELDRGVVTIEADPWDSATGHDLGGAEEEENPV
jgi:hypothetical protein